MRNLAIIFVLFFMIFSCSAAKKDGYYKGYELPSYKVLQQFGEIEIRQYQPSLIAEVEVEGERKEAANKGFMILARYIFGKNISRKKAIMAAEESSEKLTMTSPVNQISADQKKWRIQFGMPKEYGLESLPKPQDDRIKFKIIPQRKVVAIKFSGSWVDKKFAQEQESLQKFIAEKKLIKKGVAGISYYDDPFTFPWNRRNEIIQEIE